MARWPRTMWTTLFTYGTVFFGFPILCWLAYYYVPQDDAACRSSRSIPGRLHY